MIPKWRAGVVLVGACAFGVPACGGSASETPPPLEPLPREIAADRAAVAESQGDAGRAAPPAFPGMNDPTPPAAPTWGGAP